MESKYLEVFKRLSKEPFTMTISYVKLREELGILYSDLHNLAKDGYLWEEEITHGKLKDYSFKLTPKGLGVITAPKPNKTIMITAVFSALALIIAILSFLF